MSPCLHGRLFGSAGSQSVYSRQTQPSRLHPLSYQREAFSHAPDVSSSTTLPLSEIEQQFSRSCYLRWNFQLSVRSEFLMNRERRKWRQWVEHGLVIAPDCRYLIKKCNALGIGARNLVSLWLRIALPFELSVWEKENVRETSFLYLIKAENSSRY